MIGKFRGLLMIFALAVLYFTAVQHLTKLYASAHQGVETFLLRDGGVYPLIFWLGQIVSARWRRSPCSFRAGATGRRALALASVLFLVGGLAQMYVVIIGGQAYPLSFSPAWKCRARSSTARSRLRPSLPEVLLGVSGISLAMLIVALALRLLPFLPRAQAN